MRSVARVVLHNSTLQCGREDSFAENDVIRIVAAKWAGTKRVGCGPEIRRHHEPSSFVVP